MKRSLFPGTQLVAILKESVAGGKTEPPRYRTIQQSDLLGYAR